MRLTLRTQAVLLGYPSPELQANIGDIRAALASEMALSRAAMRRLEQVLARLEKQDILEAQAEYSELFDRSRALSLHLFEHVHGDSRERGQAMIDLGQQYVDRGYMLETHELPDFIPVFLEFVSCLPPAEAREILGEPAHVFAALEQRLAERGSDYSAVFGALLALAAARPDAVALEALQKNAPSDDLARIDEEWAEKPVTFSEPHEMGGPTGIVARIRAARKAKMEAQVKTKA